MRLRAEIEKNIKDKKSRVFMMAIISLAINFLYGVYNGVLGVVWNSIWFATMSIYYIILGVMKFMAVKCEYSKRTKGKIKKELFIMRIDGILLLLLTFVLTGVVCLSIKLELGKSYNTIIMITIATYTFPKVITAIVNSIKVRKNSTPIIKTIRNINVSNAVVSMFSLELSMYATFDKGGDTSHIYIVEIITGIAMCICVLTIGILMIYKSKREISDV